MSHYLLAMYQPDGNPPESLDMGAMMKELDALNTEMKDAGVWVYAGGLHFADSATVVHARGGDVVTTDGPYTEGKEHMGGFDILDVADLDEALAWATKLTSITTLPIEVRPFRWN